MSSWQVPRRGCADCRRQFTPDRRSFLKAGYPGQHGIESIPVAAAGGVGCRDKRCRRKPSVIILWMRGGPSHIDMWDPKPDAPVEYRGEFGVKPTKVPGILLTDHAADVRPDHGQVVDRPQSAPPRRRPLHRRSNLLHRLSVRPQSRRERPSQLRLDRRPATRPRESASAGLRDDSAHGARCTGSAYLGVAYKPFETKADPANPGPFRMPNFALPAGVTRRAARRPPAAARQFRPAAPRRGRSRPDERAGSLQPKGVGHPDVAGRPRRLRSRQRAAAAARALRLHAGVRSQGVEPLRRAGVEPAHSARSPAGRGRRASGDGRFALVGHARQGLRVAAPGLPAALRSSATRP